MPESRRVHGFVKTEHLFDATIAVGGDDQILPRKGWFGVGDADHDVMVKLALLVVDEQIVRTPVLAHGVEERTKHALVRQFLNDGFR